MFKALDVSDVALLAGIHAACFERRWNAGEFIALFQSGAIGWGNTQAFVFLRPAADEAEILTLATHPDFRRQGLAAQVLAEAETQLVRQGIARIFLEVRVDNEAARKLYARAHYAEIAVRKNYYTLPDGRRMDAVIMQKLL